MSSSSIPGRNRGREKHVALRQEDPLGSWGFLDSRPNSMVKKTGPPKAARFQSLEEQYDIYIYNIVSYYILYIYIILFHIMYCKYIILFHIIFCIYI